MSKCDWHVEVDRTTAAEWSQMLELFDDATIYQTSAYGEIRWGEKNLSRLVLKRDGEVVALAQLRIVRPTPLKFGMAYLRWGPLWERRGLPLDQEASRRVVRAIEDEYLCKRKLFVRAIPNAFSGSPRATEMLTAFQQFRSEPVVAQNMYRTFVLDLAPSLQELRKKLDPKWRNKLSGAERNNLKVIAGSGPEEYQVFLRMYREMKNRKNFETSVSVNEFGCIQEKLSDPQRMRILICEDKGIPLAGVVVSAMGNSAIYLLGATTDEGLKSKGAYLLQWMMIEWLKQKGVRWYDLGGINPESNPGVYLFKKGLSGSDVRHISPMIASRSSLSSASVKAGIAIKAALIRMKASGTYQTLKPQR